MRHIIIIIGLLVFAVLGWRVAGRFSADAISMMVGVFFGIMAPVPAALLVLSAQRRGEDHEPRYTQVPQPRAQIVERRVVVVLDQHGNEIGRKEKLLGVDK